MQATIRLMACLVMAASSTAVFADGDTATSAGQVDQPTHAMAYATSGATPETQTTCDEQAVGAASGEPNRTDGRAKADERAAEDAAIQEYNHRRFLEEVWRAGP